MSISTPGGIGASTGTDGCDDATAATGPDATPAAPALPPARNQSVWAARAAATSATTPPDLGALESSALDAVRALEPARLSTGDPLQALDGVKDGDFVLSVPLRAGDYKLDGYSATVKPGTVMKVSVEVRDGKLVPATGDGTDPHGTGTKVDMQPPIDLPLWLTEKGAYLEGKDAGGALYAKVGGWFDKKMQTLPSLGVADIVRGVESGAFSDASSSLPANMLDVANARFDVANATLNEDTIDTGTVRVGLAPGSKVSVSGTASNATVHGEVNISSLAMNEQGTLVHMGPGSATFDASWTRSPDGSLDAATTIRDIHASFDGLATTKPSCPGDADPDRIVLGAGKIDDGTIEACVTLPAAPGAAAVAQLEKVSLTGSGAVTDAKLGVADGAGKATLRFGVGQFTGTLGMSDDGIAVDGTLEKARVSVDGLDASDGSGEIDVDHAALAGDATVNVDTAANCLEATVKASSIDAAISKLTTAQGAQSVGLGKTTVSGSGTVAITRSGVTFDGNLKAHAAIDSLHAAGPDGSLDVGPGSTVDLDATHLAATTAGGLALTGTGKVDLALPDYAVSLPGVSATGDAHVAGSGAVSIDGGKVALSKVRGSMTVDVAKGRVGAPGKGVALDLGAGSKLGLAVAGATISSSPRATSLALGPGSRLDATLAGGTVTAGGSSVALAPGTKARLDIASLALAPGKGPALRGQLAIDANVDRASVAAILGDQNHTIAASVGGSGPVAARITVGDLTLGSDGSADLKNVSASLGRPGAPAPTPGSLPAGTLSSDDVERLSPAAIAGDAAPVGGADFDPFKVAQRLEDGSFDIAVPIGGKIGLGPASVSVPPGQEVRLHFVVKDGAIVSDETVASLAKPLTGPFGFAVQGIQVDPAGVLKLKVANLPDLDIPGLRVVDRVEDFFEQLSSAARQTGVNVPLLDLADTRVSISDADFGPGPIVLPGGTIDASSARLSVSGTPKAATITGSVAVNGLRLSQGNIALETGAGSADLHVDYTSDGGVGHAHAALSNVDADVKYAVVKQAGGDYVSLGAGHIAGASVDVSASAPIGDEGIPDLAKLEAGAPTIDIPSFSGTVAGGRMTRADATDGPKSIEIGRSAITGSVHGDPSGPMAFQGSFSSIDAAVRGFQAQTSGGGASVDYARITGRANIDYATDERLKLDGDIQSADVEVSDVDVRPQG
jgi:hypothetical protein